MVTIKDVAKLAGVSASTASRAINDNHMISQATKERVKKAMEALDYSPNYSAQNLVKRQSNAVGINFASAREPRLSWQQSFFHADYSRHRRCLYRQWLHG
ncbi:HTH-type transcriptional regulator [Streptococcus dysgalactiae]|nr:HTH-type transcriptional regulator [Streptococcus dysgalactiae]